MAKDTSENKLSSEPISIDTAKPNLDNLLNELEQAEEGECESCSI